MFDRWKFERKKNRIWARYKPQYQEAAKKKDEARLKEVRDERQNELYLLDFEIEIWKTDHVLNHAARFDIEPPAHDTEFWLTEPGKTTLLSPEGRAHLKSLIDEAEAKHFERRVRWLKILAPIVSALAALAGALTGVILALKK